MWSVMFLLAVEELSQQSSCERNAVDEELGVRDAPGLPAAAAPGARFARTTAPCGPFPGALAR